MQLGLLRLPRRIQVITEYDVVTMRQEVRQIARTLGLGLAEQAKIATAMSVLARILLARNHSAIFTLQTSNRQAQAALEIASVLGPAPADSAQLEQFWNFADVRLLVDEAIVLCDGGEAILRIRMRLKHLTRAN